VGTDWNTPAGRDIVWRLRTAKSADYLARILSGTDVSAAEKPRFMRAFDFLPASPEKNGALVQLATAGGKADEIAREALSRLKGTDLSTQPAVAAALKKALDQARGTAQFVELLRDFGAAGQSQALLDTALAITGDPAANDAIRMLMDQPDAEMVVGNALSGAKADQVITLLGTTNRGLGRLAAVISSPTQNLEVRKQAVKALARSQAGAEALLKLARAGQFPEDLKLTAAGSLALVQYATLKDDIGQFFPTPGALGGQPLPPIADLIKIKGDVAKGRAVFERAESSCITCHKIGNLGVDFAPALSEIGTKLPKEAIYEAIINPNAGVSMGFETTQLTLKDGGAGLGIVRSETADEIVLALPGGVTNRFRKSDVAKREKLATSMMPSGLNQALSQGDLVNLVEYLASLKKP